MEEEDKVEHGLKAISGEVKKGNNDHGYAKGVPKWILSKKEKVPELLSRVKSAVSAEIARKDKLQYLQKLRDEDVQEVVEFYSKDQVVEITKKQFLKFSDAELPENVKVFVIESNEQLDDCLNYACTDGNPKILGFDCEWLPNGKEKGIDLVQLAFDSCVLLIRVCKPHITKEGIFKKLKEILEDENILKFCQDPSQEVKILKSLWDVEIRGMIDTAQLGDLYCCRPFGLLSLVALFLKRRLRKDPVIQCSNWKAPSLSVQQINYAAVDAWISKQVGINILERYSKQFNISSLQTANSQISAAFRSLPPLPQQSSSAKRRISKQATSKEEENPLKKSKSSNIES